MVRIRMIVVLIVAAMTSQAAAKYVDVRDPARRERVVASLREAGQNGLDVALSAYEALQKQQAILQEAILRYESDSKFDDVSYGKGSKATAPENRLASDRRQLDEITAELEAWRMAIDEIGAQRGCSVSRLYWYTDLAEARVAAERAGRPILSLRMLGKLTDEFSCANSRFFRTALYSNKEIGDYLRDNYVLHWQSVRPVPRVTIDFGDGRKLERTLTGNSAHYVLSSNGEPLDVLPGLYAPQHFRAWLVRMQKFHGAYLANSPSERPAYLQAFHQRHHDTIMRNWSRDIQQVSGRDGTQVVTSRINAALAIERRAGDDVPEAIQAAPVAESKSVVEVPMMRFANLGGKWLEKGMDEDLWQAIANQYRERVKLDDASVAVMRAEFPKAADAGRQAYTKMVQEDPLLRVVRTFENSMTLDTVRNEYLLHRRVHERFVEAAASAEATANIADVDTLNEWVYATLFLTPSADPWLGLAPRDVYTALDNDGRTEPAITVASRSRR
jgi:hypothetical protein